MDALTVGLFFVGLVLLVIGAESLVRGASKIASTLGISPLVVGLTIVAFGTSSPEMAVSTSSALQGSADVAIGNVVGSNILNVLLILGISALVAPLAVAKQVLRLDVPIMIGVSLVLAIMAIDGKLGVVDGVILFGCALAYTGWAIVSSRRASKALVDEYTEEFGEKETTSHGLVVDVVMVVVGLVLLVLGSEWFVDGATEFAEALGVSDLIIGLTLVAAGTSMPELATSIVASIRGERDIAIGNVVGSNIFNILAVLGLTAIVSGGDVPVADSAMRADIPVMIAVAVICLPSFFTGGIIARWEGIAFVALYIAYASYLYISATASASVVDSAQVGIEATFVVVALGFGALALRQFRGGRAVTG